jgi:hypothetical protein
MCSSYETKCCQRSASKMGATDVGKREGTDRNDINLAEEFESVFIGMPKRNRISGVDRAAVNRSKRAPRCCLFAKKIRYLCHVRGVLPFPAGISIGVFRPSVATIGLQGEGAAHGWDHSRQLGRRDLESSMHPHRQSHELSTSGCVGSHKPIRVKKP